MLGGVQLAPWNFRFLLKTRAPGLNVGCSLTE